MKVEQIASVKHTASATASRVWCINWNFSGKALASCGDDKTVKIWEFAQSKDSHLRLLNTISGDQARSIRCVSFSPCGKYLASGSFDASVMIYEYKDDDFEEKSKLEGHEHEIKSCQFSVSGEFLATCSRDKTVWVWQVDENGDYEVGSILQNHSADVKFVVWHPSEEVLVSGGYDCSIRFYKYDGEDWVTFQEIQNAHDSTIWDGAFDSRGDYFSTCGADKTIKVWKSTTSSSGDNETWQKVVDYSILDTRWPLYTITWNSNTGMIAVGGGDSTIRFFTLDEENAALSLLGSTSLDSEINCLRWNPVSKNIIAACCDDGVVYIFEIDDY